SLRRISRMRKVVFRTNPKIRTTKKMIPKTSSTTSRGCSRIQPTFSAIATATRHAPSVMKKATDLRRRGLTRILHCISGAGAGIRSRGRYQEQGQVSGAGAGIRSRGRYQEQGQVSGAGAGIRSRINNLLLQPAPVFSVHLLLLPAPAPFSGA